MTQLGPDTPNNYNFTIENKYTERPWEVIEFSDRAAVRALEATKTISQKRINRKWGNIWG